MILPITNCSSFHDFSIQILDCSVTLPHDYPTTLILFWHVQLFVTLWSIAHQAPLSMGFSRQEYWIGLPFPSPGDLPNPGTEPGSPALQADSLPSELQGSPTVRYCQISLHRDCTNLNLFQQYKKVRASLFCCCPVTQLCLTL